MTRHARPSIPVDAKHPANSSTPRTWPNRDRYPRPTLLDRVREEMHAARVSAVHARNDRSVAGVDHVPRWTLLEEPTRTIDLVDVGKGRGWVSRLHLLRNIGNRCRREGPRVQHLGIGGGCFRGTRWCDVRVALREGDTPHRWRNFKQVGN